MQTKHDFKGTKGKWEVRLKKCYEGIDPDKFAIDNGYDTICETDYTDSGVARQEANAHLIAAAPEMLAELIRLQKEIEEGRLPLGKTGITYRNITSISTKH